MRKRLPASGLARRTAQFAGLIYRGPMHILPRTEQDVTCGVTGSEGVRMKLVACATLAVLASISIASFAHAQTMPLGEVLVINVPDLKPDADLKAFERYVQEQVAPAWRKSAPGMDLHLVRADRGSRKGQYMLVWTTDTLARRKGYASTTGRSPFTQEVRDKVGDFRPGFQPFVNSGGEYHEYHLIAPDTAGTLPQVEVLGIHYAKVRPERRLAFEKLVAERVHPAVANLRPDIRLLYYKSVRGPDEGDYIALFALTSASRDKYWPGGSDSDELRAAFTPEVRAVAKELRPYLVEGSYSDNEKLAAMVFESREWTDYVVLPTR
jgi:hypothetical protein